MQTTPRGAGAANRKLLRRFIERTRARLNLAAETQYEADGNINNDEVERLNALLQQLWSEHARADAAGVTVAEEDLQAKRAWGESSGEAELSCALSTLPMHCRAARRSSY